MAILILNVSGILFESFINFMTRVSGFFLLSCPSCSTVHAKAEVVSFNMMAFENWTDGRSVHSLFDHRQGLRKCVSCSGFFLEEEAGSVGFLSSHEGSQRVADRAYDIAAFLRRDADGHAAPQIFVSDTRYGKTDRSLLKRLSGWFKPSTAQKLHEVDYRSDIVGDATEKSKYPRMESVIDADLPLIIQDQHKYSRRLVFSARLLYWMSLNDEYRQAARKTIENGSDPCSSFQPTNLQVENMEELLLLLEEADLHLYRNTLAELHRELGNFDRAISLLREQTSDDEEAKTIYRAAINKVRAPVLVIYDHQK